MNCSMKVWIVKRFRKNDELLLVCDSKQSALEAISRLKSDDVVSLSPIHVTTLDDITKPVE